MMEPIGEAVPRRTPRYMLISCEVFYREMCATLARMSHQIDVAFLPKGLHDLGCKGMLARMQAAVDAVPPGAYDAILLGYGLCNNGLAGLTARDTPLVLARAHDCITLFLGSRQRYAEYFTANPGVYFKTTGWIERGSVTGELGQLSIQHQTGMDRSYAELVEKYGEDNAQYLWEMLGDHARHYRQFTYIAMGVAPDAEFARSVEEEAAARGWAFEQVEGDMGIIERMLNGTWSPDEFLVVPAGWHIVTRIGSDLIVDAAPPD